MQMLRIYCSGAGLYTGAGMKEQAWAASSAGTGSGYFDGCTLYSSLYSGA